MDGRGGGAAQRLAAPHRRADGIADVNPDSKKTVGCRGYARDGAASVAAPTVITAARMTKLIAAVKGRVGID